MQGRCSGHWSGDFKRKNTAHQTMRQTVAYGRERYLGGARIRQGVTDRASGMQGGSVEAGYVERLGAY